MPGQRQPDTLEVLSLGRVCQQLDATCRRLQVLSQETSAAQVLALAKQNIRPYYINSLTSALRSRVIDETTRMLYGPSTDGSSLVSGPAPLYLLAVLLGPDIKELRVNLCCYYGCSHQTSLLRLLATEGTGLRSLELARSALLRLDCKLFKSALVTMKNLTSLTLRNIASDAVLQAIGRSCLKLEVLDVASSRQVSDVGLKQLLLMQIEFRDKVQKRSSDSTSWSKLRVILSKLKLRGPKSEKKQREKVSSILLDIRESRTFLCDTLRVLNVANTSVSSAGVLLALMNVPRLESLADYSHVGRVVEIMSRGIGFKLPFSLTQARSSRTTVARLELLAQACPRVEKLHITEPHHPPKALELFPYVTSLSIHSIPSSLDWLRGLTEYLRSNGSNLRQLNLRVLQNEVPLELDIKQILTSCPNLRVLVVDGANIVWSEGTEPAPLKFLRKVQLGCTVSAKSINRMLSLAPELVNLHVHSCYDLTNVQLEKLLANGAMQELRCFYLYEAGKIEESTILSVLKRCAKLKRIGNLANWGLDCEGVRNLRETLHKSNIDIELCAGSHWFWSDCVC